MIDPDDDGTREKAIFYGANSGTGRGNMRRASMLPSLGINPRDAGIHAAVIRGSTPRVFVSDDASKFGNVEAPPFWQRPGTATAILVGHKVRIAVITSTDGVDYNDACAVGKLL